VSTSPLLSISIEYLRGSVESFKLEFEKGKKLTIIYGENGSGKSTVSDAFDLLGNGKVGSLDRRGLGATQRFWPSIGKTANQVKVTLETASGLCSVGIEKSDVAVTNVSLRPNVAVLRRSEILGLIEAKPADRYAQISRFVDVSGVEESEAALRELMRNKATEYNTASTRVSENRGEIERFWSQAGCPDSNAIDWAGLEVQKDRSHLDARKAAIDRLIKAWDDVAAHPQKVKQVVAQLKAAEAEQQQAEKDLNDIKDSVASDYLAVLDLLRAAQTHFLKNPNPSACPLCESSEKAKGLADEVNRRIQSQGAHTKLEAAKHAVESTTGKASTARQRVKDALNNAKEDAAALRDYCNGGDLPNDIELPSLPAPQDFAQWETWIEENRLKRTDWRSTSDACIHDKKFVGTLRRSLASLQENEKQARELETLLPRIKTIAELVAKERKKFTDDILSAISVRVSELYEAIHPKEGLNKIVLALDAGKRASLEIATEFGGKKDAPPQAYFSDSHLDTLGLCVFLALAERDAPYDRMLVLDDVLGSVDEPHVERIIGVLYEVLQKFRHAIVTTHYRPWREKFRWGVLKPDQPCHFVELGTWTFEKGISVSGAMIPEIARLKILLADPNPDVQAITGKAGVILEAILDFITLQYGCAVPRRPGNAYVLSDLLSAVNGKLLAALKAEIVENTAAGQVVSPIELKPLLEQLAAIAQTRNVLGAHFSALAFDLYPDDGIRFGRLVEQLSDALVCPEHGRPMKNTGSFWRNAGDTRRLHPLKKPS
jgi:energy-coupling factor transporter ATP-binding protein EcfA2